LIERPRELEQLARKRCEAVIAEAAKARLAAIDAAYKDLAAGFDQLRSRQAGLRLERPPTPELTAQISALGDMMRDWRASPPAPDLAEIQADYDRLAKAGDNRLKAEAAEIRRRLRRGEPLE
jgi:hypothetical protein